MKREAQFDGPLRLGNHVDVVRQQHSLRKRLRVLELGAEPLDGHGPHRDFRLVQPARHRHLLSRGHRLHEPVHFEDPLHLLRILQVAVPLILLFRRPEDLQQPLIIKVLIFLWWSSNSSSIRNRFKR